MPGVYSFLRRGWRLLPQPIKSIVQGSGSLQQLKHRLQLQVEVHAGHDDIYDEAYYAAMDEDERHSIEVIAAHITEQLRPSTLIDVGCGAGRLLQRFEALGVRAVGLERSDAAIALCRERGLAVRPFDLEHDSLDASEKYDVVVSIEVAEHLRESSADRYVDLLCGAGDTVVATAATPGQGGSGHVNEQPHRYWIDKFARRGFRFAEARSEAWRDAWKAANVLPWYSKNVLIFERPSR